MTSLKPFALPSPTVSVGYVLERLPVEPLPFKPRGGMDSLEVSFDKPSAPIQEQPIDRMFAHLRAFKQAVSFCPEALNYVDELDESGVIQLYASHQLMTSGLAAGLFSEDGIEAKVVATLIDRGVSAKTSAVLAFATVTLASC